MKSFCRGAAAGAALVPVFLWLLSRGLSTSWAAAWCAAAALAPAACGVPMAEPVSLLGVAAGLAVSTFVLVPAAGVYVALAAAAVLLAAGRGLKSAPARGDAAAAAGASAFAVALWRCLSFLLGHSLYALAAVAAGGALGLAAGRAARRPLRGADRWLPGLGPIAAGVLGLLALEVIRLVGLNAPQPEHIRSAVLGAGEALWLCAHAVAGMAAVAAALGAFELDAPAGSPAAALTPLAAAAALPLLGAPATAAVAALGLCGLGAWRGRARWPKDAVLSRAVPAVLAGALVLAVHSRQALLDVTINRLIGVYPGGNILRWKEEAGTTAAVYRFGSGYSVLLRDGVSDFEGGEPAFTLVRQTLLAGAPKSLLLAGTLHPESLAATSASQGPLRVTFYDRRRDCRAILADLTPGGKAPLPDVVDCGGRRPPHGPFDAVVAAVPPPFSAPENALQTTRQRAAAWKRRLSPSGVLAWQLPAPPNDPSARAAAAALRATFARVLVAPLGAGTVMLAGDKLDPAALDQAQSQVTWAVFDDPAVAPATDARPLAALPARL